MAEELGGLEFDGWRGLDGLSGELSVSFGLPGGDRQATVTILAPETRASNSNGLTPAEAETILQSTEAAQEAREARATLLAPAKAESHRLSD